MKNSCLVLLSVLLTQTSYAVYSPPNTKQSLVQNYTQKTKVDKAIVFLIQNKVLVVDPQTNTIKLDTESTEVNSLLSELADKGLLDYVAADKRSWCD
ncbi:MAG: hypothetical protein ACK41T_06720 [Pseudobdellovibrio sp.]